MVNGKPIVEALGYIGGQDEDLRGYCKSLVIRFEDREHYILHTMSQYRDDKDVDEVTGVERIKSKHEKVEFRTLVELTDEFQRVTERLSIDKSLHWVETDSTCGYVISREEFSTARVNYLRTS